VSEQDDNPSRPRETKKERRRARLKKAIKVIAEVFKFALPFLKKRSGR
jgi:hypothetical protein